MDMKNSGKLISSLRQEKGLTQKELAEKLSVTDKAVSRWETGKGMPDSSLIIPLAEILGVSADEILSGENAKPQNAMDSIRNLKNSSVEYLKKHKRVFVVASCVAVSVLVGLFLFYNINIYGGYEYVSFKASSLGAGIEADIIFVKDANSDSEIYDMVYIEFTNPSGDEDISDVFGVLGTDSFFEYIDDEDLWGVWVADVTDDGWDRDEKITFVNEHAEFKKSQMDEIRLIIVINDTSMELPRNEFEMDVKKGYARLNSEIVSAIEEAKS